MTFWVAIRNVVLTILTIAVIAALVVADWYLRHAPARQAERLLAGQSVPVSVESAVQASEKGEIFVLEQLEIAGVDLSEAGADGQTPLLAAMRANDPAAISFLLGREAVVGSLNEEATTPNGLRPLELALQEGDFGLASRLLELGAAPDVELEKGIPLIFQACDFRVSARCGRQS